MSDNKTKDEILDKYGGVYADCWAYSEYDVLNAMDEYASEKQKEIERLNNTIVRLRAENLQTEVKLGLAQSELNKCQEKAILWDNLSKSDKLNSLVDGESKFCEKVDKDRIKRLESELTELKEKHKNLNPVIKFLRGAGTLDGVWFGQVPDGKPKYWWREELDKYYK